MKLNILLIVSAAYCSVVGIGMIFAPDAIVFGALGDNPAAIVVQVLRGSGGTLLSITVLSWMVKNVQRSKERDAIVVFNIVAYGLATIAGLVGQVSGAPRQAMIIAVIHALFTTAFAVVFFKDRAIHTQQA